MAVLNQAVDGSHWFITHGFRDARHSIIVTYQISSKALDTLLAAGINNGDKIPDDVFRPLLDSGDLFTNKTGVERAPDSQRNPISKDAVSSGRPFVLPPPGSKALPYGHEHIRNVLLFNDGKHWVISTRAGMYLASFSTEKEAEEWWRRSCQERGVDYKEPNRKWPPLRQSPISTKKRKVQKSINPTRTRTGPSIWEINKRNSGQDSVRRKRCRSCGSIAIPGDDYCFNCRN